MKKIIIPVLLILLCYNAYSDGIPELSELTEFKISEYLGSLGEQNADSRRLNSLGLSAYKEGNLYKAAKLWYCAINSDGQYAWPHYNFACALSLFAKEFGRDPSNINFEIDWSPDIEKLLQYTDTIFHHLKKATINDIQIRNRMQTDSDLDLIRNTNTYKYLLLYPDNNPLELLGIINQWYLPNQGAYPGGSVTFEGNSVTMSGLVFHEDYGTISVTETGYFTQQGNQLTIYINSTESRQLQGELSIHYDEMGFISFFFLIIDGTQYRSTPDYSA